jgi:hypothetical protein
LDHRQQVLVINLDDPVEPFHRQDDTAAYGHGPTRVPAACAANDQRETGLVTEASHGCDLGSVGWFQNQIGCVANL